MGNFDGSGPPKTSTGPRDGGGGGKGNHVGNGQETGPRTGGDKGDCRGKGNQK